MAKYFLKDYESIKAAADQEQQRLKKIADKHLYVGQTVTYSGKIGRILKIYKYHADIQFGDLNLPAALEFIYPYEEGQPIANETGQLRLDI